jgi:hypothetical protein
VADGREARVEAIGSLPVVLHDGFTLLLNNVLYVLSLQRNLISVSLLEDDGYECLFGNNKCTIMLNDKVVGLAPRQGMLYMLSLNDFSVMNACDVPISVRRVLVIMRPHRNYNTVVYAIFRGGEWSISLRKRYFNHSTFLI